MGKLLVKKQINFHKPPKYFESSTVKIISSRSFQLVEFTNFFLDESKVFGEARKAIVERKSFLTGIISASESFH